MRIGSPSVEGALVAANVVAALLLCVVYLTQDPAVIEPADADVRARPDGPPVLVVVAADSPADVAVGRSASAALGGGLLAVPAGGLTRSITDELSGARPDRVLVLGGPALVSERTASVLQESTRGSVTRVSGRDRYATAARVATSQWTAPVARLRVMSGDDLDALRSTLHRYGEEAPLLFVETTRIPADVAAALRELRPRRIEVPTGPGAVSAAVVRQLQDFTDGPVVRQPTPP